MALELWTQGDLYSVIQDSRLDPVPSYFKDNYFATPYYSEDKEILFSKLPAKGRKLAPFVLPTEQGKPIFGVQAESVKSFTPAYIKPKDAVRPTDARTPRPSEILRQQPLTLQQRFDLRVLEIQEYHKRAIQMQWAWMCARAFIDAKLTISYGRDSGQPNPELTIDYGRAAGHTVALTGSSTDFWSDANYDIMGDVEAWMTTMYLADFGGTAAQLLVGSAVAPYFSKNAKIRELMNKNYRGSESVNVNQGLMRTVRPLTGLGQLDSGLEILTYKDQVQNDDGSMVDLLDPRDVMLIAPGAEGIMAYGAIYDADAMQSGQGAATDIFPKMFKTDDPGEVYIMNQSAPLPIPLYPNRTFKARVLQ
ncbi:MAG: major capsid protein [Devosia sp.]|nr:major capsid protein [Devosia sp.]